MNRFALSFLALFAIPASVQAQDADFDWNRCAVEVMPATARAYVAAFQNLEDGKGFLPNHHDTVTRLSMACFHAIKEHNGSEPGYLRSRSLFRYLRRNSELLVGEDKIEPSFVLFQLLDANTSPPTFMGHRSYNYMNNVLVSVVDHASTTCWVGRELKVNDLSGNEIEHLQQIWPKESLDAIFEDAGAPLSDSERAQIFPRPVCEQKTRARRGSGS